MYNVNVQKSKMMPTEYVMLALVNVNVMCCIEVAKRYSMICKSYFVTGREDMKYALSVSFPTSERLIEGMKTGSFKINIRLFGFEGICVNLETSIEENRFVSVINSTCGVSLTSIINGNTPLSNLLKHVLTSTFLLVCRNCVELPEEK